MKIRGFSVVFGIFAMCAFGLVFMGCSAAIEYPPPRTSTPTPIATDFMIENLSQMKDDVIRPVTITPYRGGSSGAISVYYDGSATLPKTRGAYAVTFDVGAATGWNAAKGLIAGTLVINDGIIDEIGGLETWLLDQAPNDKNTPYYVAIEDIYEEEFSNLLKILNEYENRYLYIDLSRSTIEVIPENAFYDTIYSSSGCKTLVGITIPDSVFSIETQAFSRCVNLVSVTIPDSVFIIEPLAFYRCLGLVTVTIGNNVTIIDSQSFMECTSLASIIIPDSVTSIGGQAFRSCTNLISVTFQGTINSNNFIENLTFPPMSYPNDLRAKFYAKDKIKGTPGTYTRSGDNSITDRWTRQP